MSEWKALSDWTVLPESFYVTSAKHDRGIVFDAVMCSVPMALAPEVRYVRADAMERLIRERDELAARVKVLEEALARIANTNDGDADLDEYGAAEVARAALGVK